MKPESGSSPVYTPLRDKPAFEHRPSLEEDGSAEEDTYSTDALIKNVTTAQNKRKLLVSRVLYVLFYFVIGIATLDSLHHRIAEFKAPGPIANCVCKGTPTQAKSAGCMWDNMESAWVRNSTQCVDFELLDEYNSIGNGPNGNWQYWSIEPNGDHINITMEEASMRLGPKSNIWITYGNHINHCIFSWRKLHRSKWTGVKNLDHNDEPHIKHCGKVALKRSPLDRINTRVMYKGPKDVEVDA